MVHVIQKNVVEGQYIEEGNPLFVVADLSQVWIRAKVYEDDIPLIRVGQAVEATVESLPGQTFKGKVAFIFPHLDPATRTIDVRYDMENPGHRLRPGMFATVTLKTPVADTPLFRNVVRQCPGSPRGRGDPAGEPDSRRSRRSARSRAPGSARWAIRRRSTSRGGRSGSAARHARLSLRPTPTSTWRSSRTRSRSSQAPRPPRSQKNCPVTGAKLGSMGNPIPVEVKGRKVWTCCKACPPKLKAEPDKYLARLAPAPSDAVLTVPELAVIDTGTRRSSTSRPSRASTRAGRSSWARASATASRCSRDSRPARRSSRPAPS